jgi:ankyrin repeat protein
MIHHIVTHFIVIIIIIIIPSFFFSGDTPLHRSANHGHLEICRLLLQFDAHLEAKNKK